MGLSVQVSKLRYLYFLRSHQNLMFPPQRVLQAMLEEDHILYIPHLHRVKRAAEIVLFKELIHTLHGRAPSSSHNFGHIVLLFRIIPYHDHLEIHPYICLIVLFFFHAFLALELIPYRYSRVMHILYYPHHSIFQLQ